MGLCFINKLELPALRAGLGEASSLNLAGLVEEGDSKCAIRWASGRCKPPWNLLDEVEEVVDTIYSSKA